MFNIIGRKNIYLHLIYSRDIKNGYVNTINVSGYFQFLD